VWLYHRFALSLRDVEELMLARGVVVSHPVLVRGSGRTTPASCAGGAPVPATSGTLMRSS
jgi:putative transposase